MINSNDINKTHRILVVDDQEINRDVLGVILEDNYEMIYACDGAEALERIREYDCEISLLMLDLMMPVMDGFEVMRRMSADESMKNIPIIVLTAERSAELQALRMGAADFIAKPFDMHEVILARVGRIIELCDGRQLISAAEHDRLTGLYSRNFFYEYAQRLFAYHPELHFDAVTVNVEQFHLVNALNGREFGNKVLTTIADAVRSFLAGSEGIAARLEADRFYIFCLPCDDYAGLLDQFQKSVDAISENVNVHLRMGVKPYEEGVDPVTLFDQARTACSRARGDYQLPLVVYDEKMRARELLHQRLFNDLNAAVAERQLNVYYQPKYNILCDPPRLSSAEALIRWKHPELGMISPGEFIPLLEGNGLIHVVDKFVWSEAARQISEWKKKYNFSLPVSVNLSRSDMFDSTLVDRLARLVRDNGLEYGDLKLEVTESAYTDDANCLLEVIGKLRSLGFQIEMDDFGSGYSSLNMLSSMPIDVLKMDMKFVRNIENNETDRKLVSLILDIASYLKVPVVAEGVESEGQLEILRKAGCDLVQGYYFSRPVPAEEFESLIIKEINTKR